MTQTALETSEPQRTRALERANEIRLARAALKRSIASGGVSAAEVILNCPDAARSWPIEDLLMSQRRWGSTRCRKFLVRDATRGSVVEEAVVPGRAPPGGARPGRPAGARRPGGAGVGGRSGRQTWIPIGAGLAPANRKNQITNATIVSPALTTSTPSSITWPGSACPRAMQLAR
jgi:hypothetical protein